MLYEPQRFISGSLYTSCVNILVIDLNFTKQLNLSSIFSILYKFSTKIVGGDNVNHLVTKVTMPLLVLGSDVGEDVPFFMSLSIDYLQLILVSS